MFDNNNNNTKMQIYKSKSSKQERYQRQKSDRYGIDVYCFFNFYA